MRLPFQDADSVADDFVALKKTMRADNLRKYSLTPQQFDAILVAQHGRCAVCQTSKPGARGWHVDHDHACCDFNGSCGDCVRGLLCGTCNAMLGMAKDSITTLAAAIEYLSK